MKKYQCVTWSKLFDSRLEYEVLTLELNIWFILLSNQKIETFHVYHTWAKLDATFARFL